MPAATSCHPNGSPPSATSPGVTPSTSPPSTSARTPRPTSPEYPLHALRHSATWASPPSFAAPPFLLRVALETAGANACRFRSPPLPPPTSRPAPCVVLQRLASLQRPDSHTARCLSGDTRPTHALRLAPLAVDAATPMCRPSGSAHHPLPHPTAPSVRLTACARESN